jgi:endoglucanase
MNFTYRFVLTCLLFGMLQNAHSQTSPFSKGINLTGWFQGNSAQQTQYNKYTIKDFEQIKSLGCDVIRLPINLHPMTSGSPDYIIDPMLLVFLDSASVWAEQTGLHLILDNHTFDPDIPTPPDIGVVLNKVWFQMADYFKDHPNHIYYEILNEPHGISDEEWNTIQWEVIENIRMVDDSHTIIVGPAGWNSYHNLELMPEYDDDNLIYTFHFYDPFIFSHQGADWPEPSLGSLRGVPFPYDSAGMPPLPEDLKDTWVESSYDNYPEEGNIAHVKELIDIAVAFRDERQVPLFCGEFGIYIPYADTNDRINWYEEVSSYLEANDIAWTTWDYHGGFGLFDTPGGGMFDHNMNTGLVAALGLEPPEQFPLVIYPDSSGFPVFTDHFETGVYESSFTSYGSLSYYADEQPKTGDFCIHWQGAARYSNVGFGFVPEKDLSYLQSNQYAAAFWIKGIGSEKTLDIRFVDTKTGPDDHPWRMRAHLSAESIGWDGKWHYIKIPMEDFEEHGSWDDGEWYPPEGKFDWQAIASFEIVLENSPLGTSELWFDEVKVVHESDVSAVQIPLGKTTEVYPNPFSKLVKIEVPGNEPIFINIYDLNGLLVYESQFIESSQANLSYLPAGIYLVQISGPNGMLSQQKMIKLK